jgi:hypothetical protein
MWLKKIHHKRSNRFLLRSIRNLKFNSSNADERIATCLPAGRRNDVAMKTDTGIIKKIIITNIVTCLIKSWSEEEWFF